MSLFRKSGRDGLKKMDAVITGADKSEYAGEVREGLSAVTKSVVGIPATRSGTRSSLS